MFLKYEYSGRNLIVYLNGELDHHSSEDIRNKFDDIIESKTFNNIIIDFSKVTFMDSSGIGVIIGRYKKLLNKKEKMCVINAKGSVKRVFELSGMFKIIPLYKNLDEALNCL